MRKFTRFDISQDARHLPPYDTGEAIGRLIFWGRRRNQMSPWLWLRLHTE